MIINIQRPMAIHELGKRQNQEDSLFPRMGEASESDTLFIVCDGMGGHEKGEVASQLVCSVMSEYIRSWMSPQSVLTDNLFREALAATYEQLDALDDGAYKKMGTTLTFLSFHRGGCTLAHIGDSRIYHIRPGERRILYKSRDHSLVYDLYQSGEITYEEMKTSPQKNVITRAIMPGLDNRMRADITHVTDIQAGDYFYLCSDGMLEQMEDDELVSLLSSTDSDEKKLNQLLAATMENRDNHSAYLIRIAKVDRETGDANLPNDEATVVWNVAKQSHDVEDVENSTIEVSSPSSSSKSFTQKQPHDRKSYLSLIVTAITFVLFLLIYGLVKGCHNQQSENSNQSSSAVPSSGSMSSPVQRAESDEHPVTQLKPKMEEVGSQRVEEEAPPKPKETPITKNSTPKQDQEEKPVKSEEDVALNPDSIAENAHGRWIKAIKNSARRQGVTENQQPTSTDQETDEQPSQEPINNE